MASGAINLPPEVRDGSHCGRWPIHGYQTNIKEAAQLLHGKQESYQEQWNNGAPPGAVTQVPIIRKKAEETLARINDQGQQQQQQPQQQPNQPNKFLIPWRGRPRIPVKM